MKRRGRRAAVPMVVVLAATLSLAACGDPKRDSDNTGHPTQGTRPPGGAPVSTPENMQD